MAQDTEYVEGIPKPGEEIAGKYRVERLIGAGGMGAVVAATHLGLGQQVAVKFLLAEAALNPNSISRFEREARAAAKIQSDHVAKVHDVGKLENGTPYMVMEFLQGEDLSGTLERGRLPLQAAVRCVLEAAEALSEAHKLGIVHRDLKPANLFLARRPDGTARVKVLDFGISKDTGLAGGAQLTRTSALMGSPVYMAPEQMESAKYVDARSDIWALGTILYEALTGVLPFNGETLPEICAKILQAEPPPLKTVLPEAPAGLEEVICRALQKRPDARFQSLAEFSAALLPFGDADAPRSVAVIHRVLGAAPPTHVSVGTGSIDIPSGPGAPTHPHSPVGAPSIAQAPVFQGTGPAGYPPAQPGGAATMPGAYGATAAGGQAIPHAATAGAHLLGQPPGAATTPSGVAPVGAMGAITGPGAITSPGAVPGAVGAITGPGVVTSPGAMPAGPMPPALGTSTAAPFSQTMGERRARSSRGGLVAAVVIAGLTVGGVATVAFVMTGGSETDASAAADTATEETSVAPSGEPIATASQDSERPAGDGGGPAEPTASAEPTAAPTAEPEPTTPTTRPVGTRTPAKTPTSPPATTPKSTAPAVPTRKGSDLF